MHQKTYITNKVELNGKYVWLHRKKLFNRYSKNNIIISVYFMKKCKHQISDRAIYNISNKFNTISGIYTLDKNDPRKKSIRIVNKTVCYAIYNSKSISQLV